MRRLIVTEKFNAAVRIATILSDGKSKRSYVEGTPAFTFTQGDDRVTVVGLRGHIINLDYPEALNDWARVDLKELVWAEPQKVVTAGKIGAALRVLAADADEVVIATDFDREGELIGVEALEIIKEARPEIRIRRSRFSALTKWDIERAFSNLVEVDYPLAWSAESRQSVDLAWGAVLTRFLSLASKQLGRDYLSVGRVQSPTLALVVDREREIENFVPQDYWTLHARFRKDVEGQPVEFDADHEHGPFWAHREALSAQANAETAARGTVREYLQNDREERPPPPFNTTMFVAEANRLGFGAAQAMKIAEDLYQSGFISYPRTDNTVYPSTVSLRSVLEKLQDSPLAAEARELLAQERIVPSRGRTEATDHPPIYPVQGATRERVKREDHWRIYELVVRRFLATVAPNALAETSEAKIGLGGEIFVAQGYRIKSLGWRKYYPYWVVREAVLPGLVVDETLERLGPITLREDQTKPPQRYSEGSLIQEMERLGLGTKSTRHEIIKKLYDRKFVEAKYPKPTTSGRAVIEALEDHAQRITQPEMTAHLEADMEGIATGVRAREDVVRESQQMLSEVLETLEANREAIGQEIEAALREQNYIGKCNVCKEGNLIVVRSRRGSRFLGCDRYPACRNTHPLPQMGTIQSAEENCPECGAPMIKHTDRGRTTTYCVASDCPTVREKNFIGRCERCGDGELTIRHGTYGKRFVGCSSYPKCDNSYPLPQRGLIVPTEDRCNACGHPVIKVINRGRPPWVLCLNMKCPAKDGKRRKAAGAMPKKAPRKRKAKPKPEAVVADLPTG
ncbi:MAG TPA: DNA topoisomerase I [Thermoplasmata archaeon]|nr:DNA topoisomerase I [Thermoplasmata archaeon]